MQLHGGVEVGGLGAPSRGFAVAAGDLVGEQQLEKIVVRQPVGACQSQ